MTYDFNKAVDRRNTSSVKWSVGEGELPMWIADMDFECAEPIRRALGEVVQHGVFGYATLPDEYAEAISNFRYRRHGHKLEPCEVVFATSVVGAISSVVRKITTPAENVVLLTPVYNIFYNCILNNGRNVLECRLVNDNGRYEIDFSDLEEKLSLNQTSLIILCNPHNPVGRIWSREELCRIGDMCLRHGVRIISDEIHCDMLDPGKSYTSFMTLDKKYKDICVCCTSVSKSFNLAGVHAAAIIVSEPHLRHKVYRALNTDEIGEPNAFAMAAAIAAYTSCDDWLDQVNAYIYENKLCAYNYIEEKIPALKAVRGDSTYLLWVDISHYTCDSVRFARLLRERTGLFVNDGAEYGSGGECYLRLNLATRREIVVDGLDRLRRFCELCDKEKIV